jgi:hypothetical protein
VSAYDDVRTQGMPAPTEQHDTAPEADEETGELPWDGFKDGRIQNFLGLDWAGKKWADLNRAIDENLAAFDAEHARRVARLKEIQAPLARERNIWQAAIEAYAKDHKSELLIGRAKSRETPSGLVLKWRERKTGEYRWDQTKTPAERTAALMEWCRKEEGVTGETLTKDNPSPDLDEIKRHLAAFKAQGEDLGCPPGLEYVPPGEVLTVTTKGESK